LINSGINLLEIAEKSAIRRELAPELKERADKHKTEGNELEMKLNKKNLKRHLNNITKRLK
jgi:hypothetical protein